MVLDGLSAPGGTGTGCRHGTPWFVGQLGPRLLTLAADPPNSLAEALAEALARSPASIPAATWPIPAPVRHDGPAPRP